MREQSRYKLSYKDSAGKHREEVHEGRGAFTRAGIGRADELKKAGATGILMVKQKSRGASGWADVETVRV